MGPGAPGVRRAVCGPAEAGAIGDNQRERAGPSPALHVAAQRCTLGAQIKKITLDFDDWQEKQSAKYLIHNY